MKTIIKLSIRVFLFFTLFEFINIFSASITNFIGWNKYNQTLMYEIGKLEILRMYFPFIIIWCIYIILIITLWIKSEIISEKIIGNSLIENINITLDFKNAISVGIILMGIYLIIDTIPKLFSYLSNVIISKTRFVDKEYLKNYTIKEIVEIIGIIIKMIMSYLLIKYRDVLISKIMEINKGKSNVA
jgi:hypothetical protein